MKCVMRLNLPDYIVGNAEIATNFTAEQIMLHAPSQKITQVIVEHPFSSEWYKLEEALKQYFEIAVCVTLCHKDSTHRKVLLEWLECIEVFPSRNNALFWHFVLPQPSLASCRLPQPTMFSS